MLTKQDVYVYSVRFRTFALLDLEGKAFHFNVKAQFRPNSVRSTYMSPQLEANTRIPVGETPFRLGLSRRHVIIAGLAYYS